MTATQALQQTGLWRGFRVWQRNLDAFRHGWKVEVGGIAVEPFVVLVALGYGLGQYVEDFGGLSYAEFVAPGVIASYAMFHATYDSTFGAYLRMETHHVYEAMLFTPLEPEDIVLGEVIWCASRAALVGFAIVAVAAMFGLVGSPLAVLAVPTAFLTGWVFAAISMNITASIKTIGAMNNYFTVILTPMFFVSGSFFPLDRLPDGVQVLGWALPLTPAVALTRGLVTGDLSWQMSLWLLELVFVGLVTLKLASVLMRRRLIK